MTATQSSTPKTHNRSGMHPPSARHYYKDPLMLVRGEGGEVWDVNEKRYIDAIGGIVCNSIGHNHPEVKSLMHEILESNTLQHTGYLVDNQYRDSSLEKILKPAPEHMTQGVFTSTGTEANEIALTAARESTGNQTIVHMEHSYHGSSSQLLGICGHKSWKFHGLPPIQKVGIKTPNCYRCPFGKIKDSCALQCINAAKETLDTQTSGRIAATIIEPVQGVGGFIIMPPEFLSAMAEMTHERGGFYISDEVQTGVGRAGGSFYHTKALGLNADAISMAKGLGNGAAAGAIIGTPNFFSGMSEKVFFQTYSGDPWTTAQVGVVVDVIERDKLWENSAKMGEFFKEEFEKLKAEFDIIGDVRCFGLMLALELVTDRTTKEGATAAAGDMMEILREEGLLVGRGGLYANVIRMAPPLNITLSEAEEIVDMLRRGFKRLESVNQKGGASVAQV